MLPQRKTSNHNPALIQLLPEFFRQKHAKLVIHAFVCARHKSLAFYKKVRYN